MPLTSEIYLNLLDLGFIPQFQGIELSRKVPGALGPDGLDAGVVQTTLGSCRAQLLMVHGLQAWEFGFGFRA